MRKVRYNVAASLDGYIAGPNGEYDWIPNDPTIDFAGLFASFDTILMGRRSYEAAQGGPSFGKKMRVYVFSRTLRQEDHPKVTVVNDDAAGVVAALREEPGEKEIWLWGGGVLFRSLLDAGQVDSVEVTVAPVLLGGGLPLITPGGLARLTLTGTKTYPSGMVTLAYSASGEQKTEGGTRKRGRKKEKS
jgi:dihydrofolate reductase